MPISKAIILLETFGLRNTALAAETLSHHDEMNNLVRAAGGLFEKSFQKVWDNPEDAEYDSL